MSGNRRRNRSLELGVLLLIAEVLSVGYDSIPPVTLAAIAGQALLYVGVIDAPWGKRDVCISGYKVINNHDFRSLLFSAFEHADDMHLYYNMISFLVKGRTLERKYGSLNFGIFLGIITILTSIFYVALAVLGSLFFEDNSIMNSCAIGFSGVIFALKFITTIEDSEGYRYIQGFRVPTRYATWVELIAIHILVPNASFMGHFAGILVGLVYTKTFIGSIIDSLLYCITGNKMTHGSRSQSRYNQERGNSNYNSNYNFFNNLLFSRMRSRGYHYD